MLDDGVWLEDECAFSASYRVVKEHYDRQKKKLMTTILVIITPEVLTLNQLVSALEKLGHKKILKYQGKIYINIDTLSFENGQHFLFDFCELLEYFSQNVMQQAG